MASAAETVFAILELAEPILLQIPMRQLFVLRRVSKSFLHVITGSVLLRRIAYLDATPERDLDDEMLNEPYALGRFYHHLKLQHLNYGGMQYTKGQSAPPANGWDVPTLSFKCEIDFQNHLPASQAHQGFQGRQKIHGPEQSWADMTINRRPSGLRIKVDVLVRHNGTDQGRYSHQTNFHLGQWIIRDLFDVFSTIQNRSFEDHRSLVGKDNLVNTVFSRTRRQEAVRGQWIFGTGLRDCFTFDPSQKTSTGEDNPTTWYIPAADAPKYEAVEKQIARLTSRRVFSDRSNLKGKIVSSSAVEACRRGLRKLEHQAKRTYAEVVRGVRQRV